MKILIISDMVGGPGGAYKYIQQIEDFLSKKNQIHLILDKTTDTYVSKNYRFKSLDFVPLSYKFHTNENIISSLSNVLNKYKPEIVHLVNGSIKSNILIRKYLIEKNIPFIVTEQFIDSSLSLDKDKLLELQYINSKTTQTIYVSESNMNIAKNIFILNPINSSIIYNAVEPAKEKKRKFNKEPYKFYTTARCVPQKGIDTIIRSLAKVDIRKITFEIIGDGEFSSEYIKLANNLLSRKHEFKISGWKKSVDYKFLLKNYDLFISASRQEGLSYSVLEAATLGMPMICSNASGNEELIKKCDRGALFNVDDHDKLTNIITEYILNPEYLNTKAINGTNVVDSIFNLDKSMKELEILYTNLTKT